MRGDMVQIFCVYWVSIQAWGQAFPHPLSNYNYIQSVRLQARDQVGARANSRL